MFRCGSCGYLAWHSLLCDGRSKDRSARCIHEWAEGSWEGQLPPALPSPCCSLAPCWGLWACAQTLQCRYPALPGSSPPSKLACNFPASVREKIPVSRSETWHFAVCSLCSPCVSFLCLRMTEYFFGVVEVSLISTGSVDEVFHVALRPAALQGDMVWPVYSVLACIYKACENFYPNLPKQVLF